MTSRVDDVRFGGRPPLAAPRYRGRTPLASGRQRLFFMLALTLFGVASFYSAIALLARVSPVVIRGKDVTDFAPVAAVINQLPAPIQPSAPPPTSIVNRRINLLVIGVDKRPGEGTIDQAAYNTDTLMVATIDPVSETVSVLSFPRDMWIDIHRPGNVVYKDRINASYATGFLQDGGTFDAGAKQLEKDIQLDFGIQIDNWAWLDFSGVEQLIDSIGGVTINIPDDLTVPEWYYTDDDHTDPHYESFPAGENTLNGYRAVAFGRYRNDSDLYRVKRQQLVLSAALSKVFAQGVLEQNPFELYSTYTSMLHTDMSNATAVSLLPLVKATHGEVTYFSMGDPVDGRPTVWGYIVPETGASVLLYDPTNAEYWVGQAFTKSQYAKSTVELASGSGTADSEDQLRGLSSYLRFQKFLPEVQLAPDVPAQPTTTIELYSDDRRPMAEDIAGWLGVPTSAIQAVKRVSAAEPDVRIVLGQDYRAPVTPVTPAAPVN